MTAGHGDALSAGADFSAGTIGYVIVLLTLSGVVPFVVGHVAGAAAVRRRFPGPSATAAFGVGVVALLFVDYFKEAADLGQASGRLGLVAGLVLSFGVGAALAIAAARRLGPDAAPAVVWALAIGSHGLGEGLLVASDVASGAFVLSVTQGASFAIHKGLEGAVLAALVGDAVPRRRLAAIVGVALAPLLIGPVLAPVAPLLLPAVAFAAGAGAALITFGPLASRAVAGAPVFRTAPWVVAGALTVFGAGLLHQF